MKDENAVALGKKGGTSTKEKYGSEYYRELQKKSVEKRKKNKAKLGLDNRLQ